MKIATEWIGDINYWRRFDYVSRKLLAWISKTPYGHGISHYAYWEVGLGMGTAHIKSINEAKELIDEELRNKGYRFAEDPKIAILLD